MRSNKVFSGCPLLEISGIIESYASHRSNQSKPLFIKSWEKFLLASATAGSGPGDHRCPFFGPKCTSPDFSDLLQYSQIDTYTCSIKPLISHVLCLSTTFSMGLRET